MKIRGKDGRFIQTRVFNKCTINTCPNYTLRQFCSYNCYWVDMKGRKLSNEIKKKMSITQKTRERSEKEFVNLKKSGAKYRFKKGHKLNLGRKLSEETKEKLRNFPWPKGANNHAWKGGITPENKLARTSKIYKNWQKAVFERDAYTCQKCNKKGHKKGGWLEAHHIKQFAIYKELRYELSNGITLCAYCHSSLDKYRYATKNISTYHN